MRFLADDDVDRLVTPASALAAVRGAFGELARGTAAIQARQRTAVGEVKLSTLGAVLVDGGVLGAKVYATVQGQFTFLVVLFSAGDGRRLAVLESDALTRLRTAATSVLATQLLARPEVARLTVYGSGVQARGHVEAFAAAGLGLREVRLVGRAAPVAAADELAERCQVAVEAVDAADVHAALNGADVVVTATRSAVPLFPSTALPVGVHVNAVGSSRPDTRELDDDTYRRAATVAVEWLPQASHEAGGLVHAAEAGALAWDQVVDLADLLAERVPGRRWPEDLTVFQSVGIGLLDVAVAAEAWRRAEDDGAGLVVG